MNKIAFTTNTSVARALVFITGLDVTAVRGLTLAADARVAVLVCKALQLAFSCAEQLFAGVYPMSLDARQYLQLSLRWCPKCLACGGYHSAKFQDWRLECCPWHGCPLKDRCSRCRCAVDPLCERPWTCNQCGEALYSPGNNWLTEFKASPESFATTHRAEAVFFKVTTGPEVTHFQDALRGRQGGGRPLWDREANILITQAACEELAALMDTVLAGHRTCVAGHAQLSILQCTLMRFSCPEAAAAVRVAAWLGGGAFSVETGWTGTARPSSRLLHGELHSELDQMPPWCRRLYVQACLRAWLLDAVREFRAAGDEAALCDWTPKVEGRPTWSFKGNTFSLSSAPDLVALESLATAGQRPALASTSS